MGVESFLAGRAASLGADGPLAGTRLTVFAASLFRVAQTTMFCVSCVSKAKPTPADEHHTFFSGKAIP